MLRRVDTWSLTFRSVVAQPVADLLVTRLRTNCFMGAAWLLLASAGVVAAVDVHGMMTGRWLALVTMGDIVWCVTLTGLADHLRRFQGSADRTHFRVVHPVFHGGHRAAFMFVGAFSFNLVIGLCGAALSREGFEQVAWHVAQTGELLPMALGLSLASCEWRRLPPVRRREVSPETGALPRPV